MVHRTRTRVAESCRTIIVLRVRHDSLSPAVSTIMPCAPHAMDNEAQKLQKEPHSSVKWCMQSLGANMDSMNDRMLDRPLTVLLILGPLVWIRMAVVVWSFVNLAHSPRVGMEVAHTTVCMCSGCSTDMEPTGIRPTTQHSH